MHFQYSVCTLLSHDCCFWYHICVCMISTPFLPAEFLVKNPLITLWGFPCMLFVAFPLLVNPFSLSLIFVNLITMCLSMLLLGLILPGTQWASWIWLTASLPMLGKFSAIMSSNIFSGPFSLFSPSGTPIMWMLVHLILSQRCLKLSSFIFFLLFRGSDFYHSVFQLTYLFFCLIYSVILSSMFFISIIVLFNSVFLFFISSSSLLNISHVLWVCASIIFPWSCIIFTIITLNSYLCRLPISNSFSCSSGVLSCSFIWNIFLCCLILTSVFVVFVLQAAGL